MTNKMSFSPKALVITAIFAAVVLFASPLFGASVSAKKNGVKIYDKASKKGAVLQELKKGESVEASERRGMYWQVTTSKGKSGFVSVMKVKRKPGGDKGLANALRNAVQEGRSKDDVASSRSRSAVMGVRGLDEGGTAFASNVKPDLRAVYLMEDNFEKSVSEVKLEKLGNRVFAEIAKKSGG